MWIMWRAILRQCPRFLLEDSLRILTPVSSSTLVPIRNFNFALSPLNAGHSKWQNIRHTKTTKDIEKSKLITKTAWRMQVAVREGGGHTDPFLNSRLSRVVDDAKEAQIPATTVARLLSNLKKKEESIPLIYVVKGPGRCTLILDVLTDNRKRSKHEITTVLNKAGATWLEQGALHQFEIVGKVVCSHFNGQPVKQDLLENSISHAIEAGAEDVLVEDHDEFGETFVFRVPELTIQQVKGSLIKLGYTCVHTDVSYVPKMCVRLSEEDMLLASKLVTKLLEISTVMCVYDNIGD